MTVGGIRFAGLTAMVVLTILTNACSVLAVRNLAADAKIYTGYRR